jgi:hypothetical protein
MALVLASTIGFTLYGDQPPEEQLFDCLRDKHGCRAGQP